MKAPTIRETYECALCHNWTSVPRVVQHAREKNHKKDMYCWKCKTTNTHTKVDHEARLRRRFESNDTKRTK